MPSNTNSYRFFEHHDVVLYMRRFMDDKEVVLLASTCRLLYQTMANRPDYWKRQYRRTFSLGDPREQEWIKWYNWNMNAIPNSTPSSSTSSLEPASWFQAYQRRQQVDRNLMAGQFERRNCQLPVDKCDQLKLVDLNPWHVLVQDKEASKIWSIQHGCFGEDDEHSNEELACNELTIPLSPFISTGQFRIMNPHGTQRFVVANVFIDTYEDLASIYACNPIMSIDEIEAPHIKKTELKYSTVLNERFPIASSTESSEKRESWTRRAVLVWSVTDCSFPKVIQLQHEHEYQQQGEKLGFVDIYNEWILFRTINIEENYHRFDLFDLNGSRWVRGPAVDNNISRACIQFASLDQCQFLTCSIMPDLVEDDTASTVAEIQYSETIDSDHERAYIRWKLFNTQKGQLQRKAISLGQIAIRHYPDATIKVEMYTNKACLIIVSSHHPKYATLLLLLVFGKSVSDDVPESIFESSNYCQSLPIDNSEQGRLEWHRYIDTNNITKLFSKKLIIVDAGRNYNVLDACNGNMLLLIFYPFHERLAPFLGPLCAMVGNKIEKIWFTDMKTRQYYEAPPCLTGRRVRDASATTRGLVRVETSNFPGFEIEPEWSNYHISSAVFGRIAKEEGNVVYKAYIPLSMQK
ncbi:hypothetical protein BDF19DRAFT_468253 [Syncephalis fuscata]|nr:hypothetical protein BDF19DRAFT_468253 [Syncephalis fuscata]